ncbi:tRNA threonylcarbamoyladenosine biosynthesis protein RimN [Maribrevibacterium harenarium]|uniref:Threonylcarbamoyl-AMP synthase n=1 Tax=Maribrevibacterium harenarium TaxID=2589817 RepID=A0A501WZS7_9GAMM|nr:Sua5/YciO/YrdC/YwlC family protein [Maribrevibacterium harenarium]TPE54340.1 tRNA threonylcarbamoyladenosine biosynthesis protein RimN [Maribrevibacterium harenarium]
MLISTAIDELAAIMRAGGVIAYPTEAVWGLGCDPNNAAAVQRILDLKQRPMEKGLILVAGAPEQLTPWANDLPVEAVARLYSKCERPTSWVVPDTTIAPTWVRGSHESIAIRLSQHPYVSRLCEAFGGPIVSTSANPASLEPARSLEEVTAYFRDNLDGILDAPLGGEQQPSQILDLLTGKPFRL